MVDAWPTGKPGVQYCSLSLVALGQGHQPMSEKAQRLFHHTWLVHGGPTGRVWLVNTCVRHIVTGMGMDTGLVNAADVLVCRRD